MIQSLDVDDPVKTVIVPCLKQWGVDLKPVYETNYFELYRSESREVLVDWRSNQMTDYRIPPKRR